MPSAGRPRGPLLTIFMECFTGGVPDPPTANVWAQGSPRVRGHDHLSHQSKRAVVW